MIFLLLLASLSLNHNTIGEPLMLFQDKHINSFCSKETDRLVVCEDDRDSLFGNLAYSRAEFEDGKLSRIDYILLKNETVARSISRQLKKQYGDPYQNSDFPGVLNQTWTDNLTDITLSYTSSQENNLGHSIIRVYLSKAKN